MRNITLNMVTRHILTRASSKYHSKNNDPSPIIPPETTVQEQASAMVEEIKTYCQAKGFDPYYVLNDNDTEYLAARLGSGESPSKVKKSFVDHAKQTVDYCCEDEEWLKLQNRLGEAAQKDLTDKLYQTISGHTKSTGFVLAISLALVGAAGAVMDDCLYDGVNHIDNPFRVYSSNPSDDVIKNTKTGCWWSNSQTGSSSTETETWSTLRPL